MSVAPSSPASRATVNEKFYSAARAGDAAALKSMLASAGSDANRLQLLNWQHPKNHKQTSLYTACKYGRSLAVELLASAPGIRLELSDDEGYAAIHVAVQEGNKHLVRTMLEQRPSLIRLQTRLGHTPLFIACMAARCACLRELLREGTGGTALIDAKDKQGFSALMAAASVNASDCIDLLCLKGVNVESVSDDGQYSALHVAVAQGHERAMRALLKHGCRGTLSGVSPVDLAIRQGHPQLSSILLKTDGIMLPRWNPINHQLYPEEFKEGAFMVCLVFVRLRATPGHTFRGLPKEIVHLVIVGLAEGYRQDYRHALLRKLASDWSDGDQKLLEVAMRQIGRDQEGNYDWAQVSMLVDGQTAESCEARFSYLQGKVRAPK